MTGFTDVSRRGFLQAAAASALAAPLAFGAEPEKKSPGRIKLGLDNFAVRAMNWKAPQLIEYAASLKLDSLFISDLDAFESLEPAHLKEIRARAADAGMQIHVGTWSICPTSTTFKDKWGNAEEHLALGIRTAQALGSPVIRVILGNGGDRLTPGGIQARIQDTIRVCKANRSRALDAGVKVAVENHAGDMRSRELVGLIEEAGTDYVGANMDSGNAVWTLEDPLQTLEILAPYVATTSLRDSAIWQSEKGATVQWTAMGDGTTDLKTYFAKFAQLCPNIPVHIETISGFNREFPYLTADFWKSYPEMKASEFAPFMALARKGTPRPTFNPPANQDRKVAEQEYQKREVERSIRYCKETLGLGEKPV